MATGDLTDLATAKRACALDGTTNSGTDAILGSLITAISAYVPQSLNVNILADNYIEMYTGNGKSSMLLRQRPVLQLVAISWPGQTITTVVDPFAGGTGMWTDGRSAYLNFDVFPRNQPVRIAYAAGYITVPADISWAVAELVAEAYTARQHVGETSHTANGQINVAFEAKAMHARIADKLKNYMHGAPC